MLFSVYCVSNQCDTHVANQIEADSMEEAFEELISSRTGDVDYDNFSITEHDEQGNFWRYEL